MKYIIKYLFFVAVAILSNCTKDNNQNPTENCVTENFFSAYSSRGFKMGFSTWSYGPELQDVDATYQFVNNNSDIYSEQIDNKIPWNAWMQDLPLPTEFTDEIASRVLRKTTDNQLLISVSLLNEDRSELAEDFDGTIPAYTELNDLTVENAYFKHVSYLINAFEPDYLVIAMEVNELKLKADHKWDTYKLLIQNVKSRIKLLHPTLKISESITLHNLYKPEVSNPEEYINEIVNYMNQQDFVAISFYPFFKNQHSKLEFQETFDFLHSKINKPIAFVETSAIAETLSIPSFNLSIEGSACEQNIYLETLLTNAQEQQYEFVIWWAHRDYDALWQTFPDDVKELGKLWRDTGLLDENGKERLSYITWKAVLDK